MERLIRFVQYNNAVPITLGILLLGGASAFAAAEPQAIFSSEQKVISVDNTYIADKDLSDYTPQVQISAITENEDTYFVSYIFKTIDVQDFVWKDVEKAGTMSVDKSVLGEYGDLGIYVAEQLKQNIDHEVDRLKEAQEIERRNVTQKTVAIEYGGLIGKLLDDTTEVFPGYTPVVTPPPPPPVEEQTAAVAASQVASPAQTASASSLTREEIERLIRDRVAELLSGSTTSTDTVQTDSPQAGDVSQTSSPSAPTPPVTEPAPPASPQPSPEATAGPAEATPAPLETSQGTAQGTAPEPEPAPEVIAEPAQEPTPVPEPAPAPEPEPAPAPPAPLETSQGTAPDAAPE